MLMLSGGDPLQRFDLFSLIEHARNCRLKVAVTLAATRLATRKALWRLREVGISRLAISMNGANAETHDGLCGQRTWEIIGVARELGIPLQINTTLQPANLSQLDAMADQIAIAKIAWWSVCFLVPVGAAAGMPRLTAEQCEQAFARLWLQSRLQSYAIETTEAPHYRRFVLEYLRQHGTGANLTRELRSQIGRGPGGKLNDGKGMMFINHAGLVCPSEFLPLVCGMFPLSHVVDVYRDSPIFRALRDSGCLEGKCSLCEYRHVCGGSRARAYAVSGNVFAQEPDCAYVPAAMQTLRET
jgi:MoaA/NifB/PqqE/SkfB family radical SAM enzyme